MSGDETSSFGDPNAQSTTLLSPKQTPTTLVFSSPGFETPKTSPGSFESSSGWTPRFAEEYSVFNATPGNLSASQGSFVDFSICTPFQQAPVTSGHKLPLSAESIATEIASHVNHLSPNPNLPLPPVDPSRRLPSSPGPLALGFGHNITRDTVRGGQEPSTKRVRLGGPLAAPTQTQTRLRTQTATPPPSRRKGERSLAPKLQTDTMHNDPNYRPEFHAGTPQQNNMASFVTSPTDMFGFPLSGPVSAALFTDSHGFWDPYPSMSHMDLDLAASGAMFQSLNHHAASVIDSSDWPRSSDMFQHESGVAPPSNQTTKPPPKRERALAPKPLAQSQENGNHDMGMFGPSYTTSADASFAMSNQNGGVDPGMLFSRPPLSSMEPATFNPLSQAAPMQHLLLQPAPLQSPARLPRELRRSASTKEAVPSRRLDMAASSYVKSTGRAGLSLSFSENRGRKTLSRGSALPPLAPAVRPGAQQNGRPAPQGSRSDGRTSPLKRNYRLSSLTSIPEDHGPKTRTSVKFTIDSRGRARAETTTVLVDNSEETTPKAIRYNKDVGYGEGNTGLSDDDNSSSDDEPIVIPSRNTSFALPDPVKPTSSHLFPPRQSRRGRQIAREESTSSLGNHGNEPAQDILDGEDDAGSEAETAMNETQSSHGDAASELRKVVEDRQKRPAVKLNPRVVTNKARPQSASSSISRLSVSEASLLTPASSQDHMVRCICKQTESPPESDDFMVECESCEMWLHGTCINIGPRTMPSVYICAFCANTPARGGRGPRLPAAAPVWATLTSPLAHKSFRSFR